MRWDSVAYLTIGHVLSLLGDNDIEDGCDKRELTLRTRCCMCQISKFATAVEVG